MAPEIIAELGLVTAEMATLEDLGGERLVLLLETRGKLIRRLISGDFDASDSRLAAILSNAVCLQEKLQRYADSLRADLSGLKSTGLLMEAVKSTVVTPQPSGLDISA